MAHKLAKPYSKYPLAAVLVATLFGTGVSADHDRDYYETEGEVVKVFVNLNAGHNRSPRRSDGYRGGADNPFEAAILRSLRTHLGEGIALVNNRRRADIILRASERDYDLDFYTVDRDREDKKYKKRDRYTGGRCGYAKRAYYTEITEKAVASYSFDITMRVKGDGRSRDRIGGRAAEEFRYATDLRAATNCGLLPTDNAPSSKVERLLGQADPSYRRHVAKEVRYKAAYDVGRKLAYSLNREVAAYQASYSTDYDRFAYKESGSNPGDTHHDIDIAVGDVVFSLFLRDDNR